MNRELRYTLQILGPQVVLAVIVYFFLLGTAIPAMTGHGLGWDKAFSAVSVVLLGFLALSVLGTTCRPQQLKSMHLLLVQEDIKQMPVYRRVHYLLTGLDWVATLFWFYAMVSVGTSTWVPGAALACYLYLGWDYMQTSLVTQRLRTEMSEMGSCLCD